MTPAFLHAVAHTRASDLERYKSDLEAMEGSVMDKYERDAIAEAIGGLLITIPALRRLERLAQARVLAERTRRKFNREQENCASVGAAIHSFPQDAKLHQKTPHLVEVSEGKGRTS